MIKINVLIGISSALISFWARPSFASCTSGEPPTTVLIESPYDGEEVAGNPIITYYSIAHEVSSDSESCPESATKVLYIDGYPVYTEYDSVTYSYTWETAEYAAGSHTIQAYAYDSNNHGVWTPVITVNLVKEAPPAPDPNEVHAYCNKNDIGRLTWAGVSGATTYEVALYVPIGEHCPKGWKTAGVSEANRDRECYVYPHDKTVAYASLRSGRKYLAYVLSYNVAGASAPTAFPEFKCP